MYWGGFSRGLSPGFAIENRIFSECYQYRPFFSYIYMQFICVLIICTLQMCKIIAKYILIPRTRFNHYAFVVHAALAFPIESVVERRLRWRFMNPNLTKSLIIFRYGRTKNKVDKAFTSGCAAIINTKTVPKNGDRITSNCAAAEIANTATGPMQRMNGDRVWRTSFLCMHLAVIIIFERRVTAQFNHNKITDGKVFRNGNILKICNEKSYDKQLGLCAT